MRRLLAVVAMLAASTVLAPEPAHAGGGCHGSSQPSGSGSTVTLSMNCMTPRVLHAPAGAVTFENTDGVTHNLTADTWGVDELRSGQTFARDFAPGTYVFSCTLHPGMVGALVVGESSGGFRRPPVSAVAQVRAATSTQRNDADDRLLLGLLLGALVGVVVTLGARTLRSRAAVERN